MTTPGVNLVGGQTCLHVLCAGYDIVWNAQSALRDMWSPATRTRTVRICNR